jgi:hypothetical protein
MYFQKIPTSEIGKQLNRTEASVRIRISKLIRGM